MKKAVNTPSREIRKVIKTMRTKGLNKLKCLLRTKMKTFSNLILEAR